MEGFDTSIDNMILKRQRDDVAWDLERTIVEIKRVCRDAEIIDDKEFIVAQLYEIVDTLDKTYPWEK